MFLNFIIHESSPENRYTHIIIHLCILEAMHCVLNAALDYDFIAWYEMLPRPCIMD